MDNITHTLVGLALAESGLKHRSGLATATLLIGANLPDVDGFLYFVASGTDALAFRRGWTHGVLAMAVLPLLLSAAIVGWARLTKRHLDPARSPVDVRWVLALAAIGVGSHPLLDLLNTYGVRLLMPFSGRWFYGDALFILVPWVWLVLGLGIALSRWRAGRATDSSSPGPGTARRWTASPARAALAACLLYAAGMIVSSRLGVRIVEQEAGGPPAISTLVAPVFLNPFRRSVIRDLGDQYERGVLTWGWPVRYAATAREPAGFDQPGARAASTTKAGTLFLRWSRFPQFEADRSGESIRVLIRDLRYSGGGGSWATVSIRVPAGAR